MPTPQGDGGRGPPSGARLLIANGAVRLFRRFTGRGPTHARVSIQDDLAVIVLRETLSQYELKLIQAGQGEGVLRLRDAGQEAMRGELISLIEEHLGAEVEAFFSHNSIDPDLALEVFVLTPRLSPEEKSEGHTLEAAELSE